MPRQKMFYFEILSKLVNSSFYTLATIAVSEFLKAFTEITKKSYSFKSREYQKMNFMILKLVF